MLKRLLDRYPPTKLGSMGVKWIHRRVTSHRRKLPDFLIIGGQRCGTTSMYSYLVQHPDIPSSFLKETHFFDRNYNKGIDWYRTYFSLQTSNNGTNSTKTNIIGEATPIYLFHPQIPKRVFDSLPKVKLIVLLRNPVMRAHSHYQMNIRLGIENRSFEDAVKSEMTNMTHIQPDSSANNLVGRDQHFHYSYLQRGQYADQIMRWQRYFKSDQFLVIKSEDFFHEPQIIMQDVFNFLQVKEFEIPELKNHNSGEYETMPAYIRAKLEEYFDPFNFQLNLLLERDFSWY